MTGTHPRGGRRLLLLGALAVAGTACASRTPEAGGPADAAATGPDVRTARLVAQQSPPVGGTVTLSPATGGGLFAQIRIQGSPASGVAHPWRIFFGTCGVRGGSIVGSGADYPIVQMQADGNGESRARIERARLSGAMHVRVYASSTGGTVIACGDFH
jgi:hypothetical protein